MQEKEGHTFDDTYDFTLWKSEAGSVSEHDRRPAVRVALAYGVRAELPGEETVR